MQTEGVNVQPDIMIPLVGTAAELQHQTAMIRETADKVGRCRLTPG